MKKNLIIGFLISTLLPWLLPAQPIDAAEQLDITVCYSGTGISFHDSKEVMPVFSWTQNGIIMSHTPNKMLDGAVVHCEGVQRGTDVSPERTGYALCKIVDDGGHMIIAEIPYSGFVYEVKFLEGTGKWKGIKGALRSERIVRSKPGKGAMPGTYQGCRREKGSFELSK
jgi:hypothetical protein